LPYINQHMQIITDPKSCHMGAVCPDIIAHRLASYAHVGTSAGRSEIDNLKTRRFCFTAGSFGK
jgi:hypothetical protein